MDRPTGIRFSQIEGRATQSDRAGVLAHLDH
jgi:hypothetical protein